MIPKHDTRQFINLYVNEEVGEVYFSNQSTLVMSFGKDFNKG